MIFEKSITITKDTASTSKKVNFFHLTGGVIYLVEIQFPPGCANLVHVQLRDGGHQFIPSTHDQDIADDNHTVSLKEFYELKRTSRIISIRSWNTDDTYDHTIRVRIGVLPKAVVDPKLFTTELLDKLDTLLKRIGAI